MKNLQLVLNQMISISEKEIEKFTSMCYPKTFKKKALLSEIGKIPNDVFFIEKGLIRVLIIDLEGIEHTVHFAMENQFISDYASFMQQKVGIYNLQALEETEVIVMPRKAIEWGYQELQQGDRLGRYVAEYYFNYLDNRIHNLYTKTPKERYDLMAEIFPNIHNRVPQHMIASYIGITPVHLSRIKKMELKV